MMPSPPVRVWFWTLSDAVDSDGPEWAMLSADEIAHAGRLATPLLKARYVSRRARVRALLGDCLSRPGKSLRFELGAHGKPTVAGADQTGLHFNVSRTEGFAALAVRIGQPVGVDIERVRFVEPAVAGNFSPAEQAALGALPKSAWLQGFYCGWTRKEAVIKADGRGLAMKLDTFDVTLAPDAPARLLRLEGDPRATLWRLVHFEPAAGVVGALALPGATADTVVDFTVE